ncbi:MAG: alpha-amylase family glycosyl hydrolase, partial [Candidatus Wallbacteria bacterium]|nr:alpha-amylase family glycosyl hydrolase [Candidatus Wallbacteria bacterium]
MGINSHRVLLAVLVLSAIPIFCSGINGSSNDILLQGFHWKSHATHPWWEAVSRNAGQIADSGITIVWLPPPSASAAVEGYLPNRLNVLDSAYGTKDQLKNAIASLKSNGVKAIADVVINHRVGTNDWADFTDPAWGADAVCRDDEWPGAQGGADTGTGFNAGRDIDHNNTTVRDSLIQWMKMLKSDIGFDGWRYDYGRGYHASFVAMYNQATAPGFSVGEIWTDLDINNPDYHRQQICNWLDDADGLSAGFDFTTKGLLQNAVSTGQYWRLKDR